MKREVEKRVSPITKVRMLASKIVELDRNRRLQLEALQTRSAEQLKEEVILTDVMAGMLPDLPEQMRQRDVCLARLAQDEVTQSNSLVALPSSPTKHPKNDAIKRKKKPKKLPVVEITGNIAEAVENHENRSGRSSRGEKKSTEIVTPLPHKVAAPQGPHTVLRSHTVQPVRLGLGRHVDRILAEQGLRKQHLLYFTSCSTCLSFN
jgi:hypothetical protein